MNLYVGNLSYQMKESELQDLFSEFGEVTSVKIITDKFTGRSKGFAFVDMASDDAGNNAIQSLHGKDMKDRAITVNEARPREEGNFSSRPPRTGGNGGGGGGYRGGNGGGGNR
jgi:RNA recognition motif-containing protein